MWKPRRLTTLWASMVCYRDSFIFTLEVSGHFLIEILYLPCDWRKLCNLHSGYSVFQPRLGSGGSLVQEKSFIGKSTRSETTPAALPPSQFPFSPVFLQVCVQELNSPSFIATMFVSWRLMRWLLSHINWCLYVLGRERMRKGVRCRLTHTRADLPTATRKK
jgi:hypothetical protein